MNSNVGKNPTGNRDVRPPIPSATFPFTSDVTEEFPSIEAKVWKAVDETASIGTSTKKKNKRSAYTATTNSSPSVQPLPTTDIPSTPVMTDAIQNQINTVSDVSLAHMTTPTAVPSDIDGMVPGGTVWEDPFGGMTLDEDVVGQQTPIITRQYSTNTGSSMGLQETPSPQDNVNHLAAQSNLSQGVMHPAKVIHDNQTL